MPSPETLLRLDAAVETVLEGFTGEECKRREVALNEIMVLLSIETAARDKLIEELKAMKVEEILVGLKKDSGKALERQESLTSALWGFAYDLQHTKHDCTDVDGTSVNLAAVGRAQEIILSVFGQEKISIQ